MINIKVPDLRFDFVRMPCKPMRSACVLTFVEIKDIIRCGVPHYDETFLLDSESAIDDQPLIENEDISFRLKN